jgi:hypothetical protein
VADEFAVPVAALPQVDVRRYDVERRERVGGVDCWRILETRVSESAYTALDTYLQLLPGPVEAGVYRVTTRESYAITRLFDVRPSFTVSDHVEPESEEASPGDGDW